MALVRTKSASRKYPSIPALKRKLWKEFSWYIRQRDEGVCFTCGRRDDPRNTDAGHYIPKSVGGANLYFNEKNVHCQCTACNRFRHGNLHQYALRLQEKYGAPILVWLEAWRQKSTPYNAAELTLLIKHYKNLNAKFGKDDSRSPGRSTGRRMAA